MRWRIILQNGFAPSRRFSLTAGRLFAAQAFCRTLRPRHGHCRRAGPARKRDTEAYRCLPPAARLQLVPARPHLRDLLHGALQLQRLQGPLRGDVPLRQGRSGSDRHRRLLDLRALGDAQRTPCRPLRRQARHPHRRGGGGGDQPGDRRHVPLRLADAADPLHEPALRVQLLLPELRRAQRGQGERALVSRARARVLRRRVRDHDLDRLHARADGGWLLAGQLPLLRHLPRARRGAVDHGADRLAGGQRYTWESRAPRFRHRRRLQRRRHPGRSLLRLPQGLHQSGDAHAGRR